uniref:FHA domain-containing protein n=1 Tax=Anopheles dirus TaxID=7168 RepID=A0A182N9Y0_9DIPT
MKQLVIIDTVRNTRKVVPENGQYIGRGKFIECDDKRISRTHGRISTEFKQEKLLLRLVSLHTNAIFCRKKDSDKDYTLNNDDIILLEIGDKFRLLQDGGWFEVGEATPEDELPSSEMSLSGVESNSHETVTEDDPSSKRKHETENDAGTSKKSRISDDDSLERPSTSSQSTNVPSNPDPELPTTESATAATVKPDPDSIPTSSTEVKVNIKPDPDAIGSSTGVSSNDPGVSGNIGIIQALRYATPERMVFRVLPVMVYCDRRVITVYAVIVVVKTTVIRTRTRVILITEDQISLQLRRAHRCAHLVPVVTGEILNISKILIIPIRVSMIYT